MFKNLDGFKKVHEDKDKAIMMHKKGHTVTIAMNALPALQRKQLSALPLHKYEGGKIKKYVEGSGDVEQEIAAEDAQNGPPPVQNPATDESVPDSGRTAAQELADEDLAAHGPQPTNTPPPQLSVAPISSVPAPTALPAPFAATEESAVDKDSPSSMTPTAAVAPKSEKAPTAQISENAAGKYDEIPGANQYLRGLKEQAAAAGQQANYNAMAEREYRQSVSEADAEWKNTSAGMQDDIAGSLRDMKNGHINPKSYMENMQAPQRVATAIGLFLGGLSTPFTHQANPAMEMLNKQIDRDIDAQKAGLNNKMNVYHGFLEKYKNAEVAEQMTRATQYGVYASKIREIAASSGSPMAKALADQAAGKYENSLISTMLNSQLVKATAPFQGSGGGGSEAQYQKALSAAQSINPERYKDLSSKYIPGVGTTQIPADKDDIAELSAYKNLNELAKQAQAFAQDKGRTFWGSNQNQQANDLRDQMRLQLGQLEHLNRINEYEAKKYDEMVNSPGAWNSGQAIQSFKDFRGQIAGKAQSLGTKLGIKPFRR